MSEPLSPEAIIEAVEASPHRKVKVAITDIDGILRGKFMQKEKFLSAVEGGFGFCDVVFGWDSADECYDNVSVTGWHSGYPDAPARIDLSTYRTIPWEDDVPFFLADFVDADGPYPVCPRQLLKTVIARVEDAGYHPSFGMEFEWWNFEETPRSIHEKGFKNLTPLTPGMFGYSILRASLRDDFFTALFDQLTDFDVPIEGLHTETGPGVYEAAILYGPALTAGDRATLFKTGAKQIAYRLGIIATFMARWNTDLPGSSGHLHQSLWRDGANLFHDPQGEHAMSDVFRHYIAGQMRCLPEILPMFAPTVNSFKRLCPGFWAPTKVTWSVDNRTVALRALPGGAASSRLETRVPGADANPYLAIAAALAAGFYGVQNKLELTEPPVQGNGYEADAVELPGSLRDAATRMRDSALARELFGDAFVDHYAASRLWEARRFEQAVTDWELERYLEII